MGKRQRSQGRKNKARADVEEDDLVRFAGSSDEEEDKPITLPTENDVDDEESENERTDEPIVDGDGSGDDAMDEEEEMASEKPVVTSEGNTEQNTEPSEKMASAIARILGNSTKSSSVVLAKTVTPLQRLQKKEKEKAKELKKKRQANRERNLAALHIPLSVATTNSIGSGRLSLSKELEQERFHRRVATRGVVALFNAISQHQHSTEDDTMSTKHSDSTKLTKHGFMDKIKSKAADRGSESRNVAEKSKLDGDTREEPTAKWDALKDSYMMKPKKNWDEDSSDGETSISRKQTNDKEDGKTSKKRRTSKRRE